MLAIIRYFARLHRIHELSGRWVVAHRSARCSPKAFGNPFNDLEHQETTEAMIDNRQLATTLRKTGYCQSV